MSNVPLGNMSYWFEGTSIVITLNLTAGMLSKPLGLFVNKTSPPTAPPSQLDTNVSPAAEQALCCKALDKTGVQCHASGAARLRKSSDLKQADTTPQAASRICWIA